MGSIDTVVRRAYLATLRAASRYACVLAAVGLSQALAIPALAAGGKLNQPPQVEGRLWTLVEYAGLDGSTQPVLPATEISATFQGGRLSGSAGCNIYSGAYSVTGSALTLSGTAGTLRLCPGPPGIMEQEAAYLAALGRVAQFAVTQQGLTLYDRDGAILLTYAPQPKTPLEGTTWTAQAYNNGRGGVVSLIEGTEITARFEGGRVAGSAGCNTYTAAYSVNGNAIEIGPAANTRMACVAPPGTMEQEQAYLAALGMARVYRLEGSRLILETADGARVASFVPAAESAVLNGVVTYRERMALPPS
jgi:heat shock protein HslJ